MEQQYATMSYVPTATLLCCKRAFGKDSAATGMHLNEVD